MAFTGCSSSSGPDGPGEQTPKATPTGEPDQLTIVDPKTMAGLDEKRESEESGGVQSEISYPVLPNADPLTERMSEVSEQAVEDFKLLHSDGNSISADWNITAAGGKIVGVRLTSDREGDEAGITAHKTLWYDAKTGRTSPAGELIAGQQELDELTKAVKKELEANDEVKASSIQPIAKLFDSMGFNPQGDLVVEFDDGEVAPADAGRIFTVIPRADAEQLLSGLGERALAAATAVTPDFKLTKSAPTPKSDPRSQQGAGVMPATEDDTDCSAEETKCIALTFDDGPGGGTPRLLDTLAEHDAKATFFLTGEMAMEFSDTIRREYAEGHEVANHTMTHQDLTGLSPESIHAETAPVNALIRRETGTTPELMRPPYGATNDTVSDTMKEAGMAQIIWSVDTLDWKDRDSGIVTERAVDAAQPGSIVLFHDIHPTTIQAIPGVLEQLSDKGYTFVTVSELLGDDLEAGESYFDGHPEEEPSPSSSPSAND